MNQLPAEFYVLDTETTGLGETDEIVEIAIINQEGEAILNTLIKPRKTIPDEAIAIHGITNDMVVEAPSWADIKLYLHYLGFSTVYIYNADFDKRLWQQTSGLYRKESPQVMTGKYVDFRCVMKMANKALGTDRWVSLANAAEHYGITFDGLTPHRAASDCAVTLDVLRAMHGLPPIATGEHAKRYGVVL